MATTLHASLVPPPSSTTASTPPPPSTPLSRLAQLPSSTSSGPGSSRSSPPPGSPGGIGGGYGPTSLQRNASTASSRSNTTSESTSSSLVAVPIRPPPIQTRTAATSEAQLPSPGVDVAPYSSFIDRHGSHAQGYFHGHHGKHDGHGNGNGYGTPGEEYGYGVPSTTGSYGYGSDWESNEQQHGTYYGGRGFMRNGPRMGRQNTAPLLPSIITSSSSPSLCEPDRPLSPLAPPIRPSTTAPGTTISPTTPRAPRLPLPGQPVHSRSDSVSSPTQPRVTISLDPTEALPPPSPVSPVRSRPSSGSIPNSPVIRGRFDKAKDRTLSVDGVPEGMAVRSHAASARSASADRERRQSQVSTHSNSSKKPSLKDYILGEELGRGSYSTVVRATLAPTSNMFPTSPSSTDRHYAIKIMNQAHLVQEKKIKYAHIERDALIRLSQPRQVSPTSRTHRRGVSSSSSAGLINAGVATSKRKSNNSVGSSSGISGALVVKRRDSTGTSGVGSSPTPIPGTGRELLSVVTALSDSSSSAGSNIMTPLSPVLAAGRRPSRSAEPPERVDERGEPDDPHDQGDHKEILTPPRVISRPPSPVKEEPSTPEYNEASTRLRTRSTPGGDIDSSVHLSPTSAVSQVNVQASPMAIERDREREKSKTPGKRRTSLAPSERSVKSTSTSGMAGVGHPGIIRLYCTFADKTSVFYVLDLASNGELASFIRKYGSLDTNSARYYAAQIVDTIEFVHEREIIHRDLKPENVLLDDDMRIKLTDFGSAKILGKESEPSETSKRSFVGSADYVSPEVLRSEPATFAADTWALGVIIYDFIAGKPPFRSATEYLTFQKVLQRQLSFPDGFDPDARDLVDQLLNLDPTQRPNPAEIKNHPFFASVDWNTLWSIPAPQIHTGLRQPVKTLANVDLNSDVWAVFDDEVSDGGFEYDDDGEGDGVGEGEGEEHGAMPRHGGVRSEQVRGRLDSQGPLETLSPESSQLGHQLTYDRLQAKNAIEAVDHPGIHFPSRQTTPGFHSLTDNGDLPTDAYPQSELDPPRRAWLDSHPQPGAGTQSHGYGGGAGAGYGSQRKGRGLSSSSSSSGRLSGLLESMGINPPFSSSGGAGYKGSPSRNSRASERSDERERYENTVRGIHSRAQTPEVVDKWSSVLLGNERIILSTPISVRPAPTVPLPSFLLPAPKRRQLILTDFPRLIAVKDDAAGESTSPTSSTATASAGSSPALSTSVGGNMSGSTGSVGHGSGSGSGSGSGAGAGAGSGAGLKVKIECVFLVRPSTRGGGTSPAGQGEGGGGGGGGGGGVNCVLDVQEKGSKAFSVQTISQTHMFVTDSNEVRDTWVQALRRIVPT